MILCPEHNTPLEPAADGSGFVCPAGCRYPSPGPNVVDLLRPEALTEATANHYSLQWGGEVDFAAFYRQNQAATKVMTSKQMGWPRLIDEIRTRAAGEPLSLFDAACGYGGLFMDLFSDPAPAHLTYTGADIHGALGHIRQPEKLAPSRIRFLRWDISAPLPTDERFDVVICRAAIHHTPDPRGTFTSLVSRLAPGGTIAITVYAKKAPMREASDDALRAAIGSMPPRDALALSRQFTVLGRDLQASGGRVVISQELSFLGIKAGEYDIHSFIYDHFLKCWYNEGFGERYSNIVNFDWYHPEFAYRYDLDEVLRWFDEEGVAVTATDTTKAQHYLEGRRPG